MATKYKPGDRVKYWMPYSYQMLSGTVEKYLHSGYYSIKHIYGSMYTVPLRRMKLAASEKPKLPKDGVDNWI